MFHGLTFRGREILVNEVKEKEVCLIDVSNSRGFCPSSLNKEHGQIIGTEVRNTLTADAASYLSLYSSLFIYFFSKLYNKAR